MINLQTAAAKYLLIAGLTVMVLWMAYAKVYDRGYRAAQAECTEKADKVNANNEQAASDAGAKLNAEVGEKLPAIERNAYESQERIRTVYVDRPVSGDCAWSGGVLDELEAGRKAANRAVRGGAAGEHSTDSR